MRPQPYKRCGASVRRKNFSGSFWNSSVEAFEEFLKTRVVAKRVEPLVYLDAAEQALQQNVAFHETSLEQTQRFVLLAKREMNDGKRIGAYILLRGKSSELIEDFTGFPHATGLGIGVRKHCIVRRRRTYLICLAVFRDRFVELAFIFISLAKDLVSRN